MSSDQVAAGPPPGGARRCPHCGAPLREPTATRCWLCETELTPQDTTGEGDAGTRELLQRIRRPDTGSELVTGVVLLSILLGLLAIALLGTAPGLLIAFALVGTPLLIRLTTASRAQEGNGPVRPTTALGVFFSTLGTIILIGIAAVGSFLIACFAVCLGAMALDKVGTRGDSIFMIAALMGIPLGLYIFFVLVRSILRRRQ
jgi:hypothetical protein